MKKWIIGFSLGIISIFFLATSSSAVSCTFTEVGTTRFLDSDCATDTTILVPDGYTLDGNGHTITAVDPAVGHFVGAVVANGGDEAHVTNLNITTDNLSNACDSEADRLRGIMFNSASGSITNNSVDGINQGESGCQEGNAIEVRNAPLDGSHPDTQNVEISHNVLTNWQKTGIVCNGDVDCNIHHNDVDESATQENLAANSIQLGFGASGSVMHNNIEGNQWMGTSPFAATAILTYLAGRSENAVEVGFNNIKGNSDVGIFPVFGVGTYINNRVFDQGIDHPNSDWDVGIWNFPGDNRFRRNVVRGFEDASYIGVVGGRNITVPGPQPGNDAFGTLPDPSP